MREGNEAKPLDSKPNQEAMPTCPYCQRHFNTLDDLTFHIVTRHTSQIGKVREPAQTGGAKSK